MASQITRNKRQIARNRVGIHKNFLGAQKLAKIQAKQTRQLRFLEGKSKAARRLRA